MSTTEKFVVDRTEAYTYDASVPTNVLTASGFHLVAPNVRLILEDFISSGDHAMSAAVVLSSADEEFRALQFLYGLTGFAVFPVYSGTGDEHFEGYLVIYDEDAKVCRIDGGNYLGSGTITQAELLAGIITQMQDVVRQAEYLATEDPAGLLSLSITEVTGLVNFPEE